MTWPRKFLLAIVGIAAALVLIVGAGRLLLATRGGQTFVTERVLNLIDLPGQSIAVASTDGAWPGYIILNGITVRDREGVWLTIDSLALDWHPARLLRNQIVIDSVTAGTLTVSRAPVGSQGGGADAAFDPGGIFRTLRDVHVGRLTVATARVETPVFGEAATLAASGTLGDEGGGKVLVLDLDRSDQPGRAHLSLAASPQSLRLQVDAATAGLAARADLSAAGASHALSGTARLERTAEHGTGNITAALAGTWNNPSLTAEFEVGNLLAAGRPVARLAGTLRAQRIQTGTYALTGDGTLSDVQEALPELAAVVSPEGRWTVNVGAAGAAGVTVELFEITAGDARLTLAGAMAGGDITPATATLRLRGLGRLAGVADDASVTTAVLTASRLTTAGIGEGTLRVTTGNLPRGLPDLNAAARWNADDTALRVSDVTGLGAEIKLAGTSTWPRRGDVLDHGATHLTLAAPAARLGFAGGEPLTVTADVTGPLASLAAQIEARGARLGEGDAGLSDLVATLAVAHGAAGYEATLDTRATWRGAPATLNAQATPAGDAEMAITLNGVGAAGRMDGDLRLDTRSGLATGIVTAHLDDIGPLANAFGIDAAGALEARATLGAAGAAQQAEATVTIKDLVTNPLGAPVISLTARVEDARRSPRFEAVVSSAGGRLADRPFEKLNAQISGTPQDFEVGLEASGPAAAPLLMLQARVLEGADTAITVTRLEANDGTFSAALTSPATVTISPQSITVDAIDAALAGGRLTGSLIAARDGSSIAADLDVKGVSVSAVVPALPAGTLDGRVAVSGLLRNASATIGLAAGFTADALNATPAFTVAADVRIADGRMQASATVEGISPKPATLSAQLPLSLDLSAPRVSVDMDAPLAAAAAWTGDIAPLWRMLPIDDHLLSGAADLDVKISGTPGAPQIAGGVKIAAGRYENIPAGLVLSNVALALTTVRGDDLAVTMTATDNARGRLTLSGRLDRDAQGAWTADLAGDLERLAVVMRDQVTVAASGKVTYRGALLAGELAGSLAMSSGAIHLDSTGVPEVPLLRSFAALKADTFETLAPEAPPASMTLNVSLTMADPLTIEGRGLQSAWRGDLYVRGSISAPDVVGALVLERGTFAFLGQTFELESGTVTFTGGGRIDPQLNVTAVREVTDITATVNITGSAGAPTITLSSRPSLPQDEVLARLLFNRNMGELGPLESIQLASAAADMSGLARGGISGVVRRSLRLDTFGFGGQSGNALVAGRQIGRNIFVTVEQNVDDTNRVFTITWRLTRHFSLRSSARDQTGADFGVFWRKDY